MYIPRLSGFPVLGWFFRKRESDPDDSQGSPEGGGLPPIAIIGGAALAFYLLTRK